MKKWIVPILFLGVLVLGGIWLAIVNSELERLDTNINEQWKRVEAVHTERVALIPNLMASAKNYAEFDEETLNDVHKAHQKAHVIPMAGTHVDITHLNRFQQQQEALSNSLQSLQNIIERYPYLKTNEKFEASLQKLNDLHRDIQIEESRFNEEVGLYNIELQGFPKELFASWLGYQQRNFFTPKN